MRRWLLREFRQWRAVVGEGAAASRADRYRKHFRATHHAGVLLVHGLSGSGSLRQTYAALSVHPDLRQLLDLAGPDSAEPTLRVSYSQVADSSHSRPAAFLDPLLVHLLGRVRQQAPAPEQRLLAKLTLLDSTCLRLSLKLARWLPTGTNGVNRSVRVLVAYAPAEDLPEPLVLTTHRQNDVQRLDTALLTNPERLAAWEGQTLVFDLGFYSHARFAQLRAASIHFVSRAHPQALIHPDPTPPASPPASDPLPDPRITVTADQAVAIGSTKNRAGARLTGLRVVTAQVDPTPAARRQGKTPVTYTLLTDRWDLTAQEVVQAYLWRWQIELLFRWLKSHLGLTRLLGHSENAVQLTIRLAIIVHLLTVLAAQALGHARRSPTVQIILAQDLAALTLPPGSPSPELAWQLSLPGFDPILYPLLHPT